MRLVCGLLSLLVLITGCQREPVEEIYAPQTSSADVGHPIEIPPESWPWWRGPERNNVVTDGVVDFQWSSQPSVAWSTKIQGLGHSSPIVLGDKVLITTADEKQETKSLLCYDAANGKPLWTTAVHQGGFMRTHQKNSQASATPASDGKFVFTAFVVKDSLYVTAVDLSGKIVWQKEAGPFYSQHGYGSSPVLYESLVIVLADSNGPGFLAALRRDTGEVVWRISRSNEPSYGSPILAGVGGKQQLLVGGTGHTIGYNPDNGQEIWRVKGPAATTANTPNVAGELVISTGGFPRNGALGIQADGSGDVTFDKVVWEARERIYVPSPLVADGKVFAVNDDGIGLCYDAKTGQRLARKRIGGNFSASLTRYGDQMLAPDEQGTMHVFKVGPEFDEIASFRLEGNGFASPVFAGGKLFWRTSTHLYCLVPGTPTP